MWTAFAMPVQARDNLLESVFSPTIWVPGTKFRSSV